MEVLNFIPSKRTSQNLSTVFKIFTIMFEILIDIQNIGVSTINLNDKNQTFIFPAVSRLIMNQKKILLQSIEKDVLSICQAYISWCIHKFVRILTIKEMVH